MVISGLRRLWGLWAPKDRTAGMGADENFDPVSGAAGESLGMKKSYR